MFENPKSKFIKIRCKSCNNEQVVFDKASTEVKCNVCNNTLIKPTGGLAKMEAEKIAVLE